MTWSGRWSGPHRLEHPRPMVDSIKQLIMEDYIQVKGLPEISWKEILKTTRAHCKGYHNVNIASLMARGLDREGINIWR